MMGGGARGGFCQPSEAVVVRKLACGNTIAMKVDLNKALESTSERVIIQPDDVIVVRYTLAEELGNVFLSIFQVNYFLGNGLR